MDSERAESTFLLSRARPYSLAVGRFVGQLYTKFFLLRKRGKIGFVSKLTNRCEVTRKSLYL